MCPEESWLRVQAMNFMALSRMQAISYLGCFCATVLLQSRVLLLAVLFCLSALLSLDSLLRAQRVGLVARFNSRRSFRRRFFLRFCSYRAEISRLRRACRIISIAIDQFRRSLKSPNGLRSPGYFTYLLSFQQHGQTCSPRIGSHCIWQSGGRWTWVC
jgi:hypothetical protein